MENNLEFYTLPFKSGIEKDYIYDANDNLAFLFLPILSQAQVNKMLESLNSEEHKPLLYKEDITLGYLKNRNVITLNSKDYILIRGWQNLLNVHNFSEEKATEIQLNLVNYILTKMQ